jgi:hypothetical protein
MYVSRTELKKSTTCVVQTCVFPSYNGINIPVLNQEYVALLNYLFQAIMHTIIEGTLADLV